MRIRMVWSEWRIGLFSAITLNKPSYPRYARERLEPRVARLSDPQWDKFAVFV
jgi:hypothetical protein